MNPGLLAGLRAALCGTFLLLQPAWATDTAELNRQLQAVQQQLTALDARLDKQEGSAQSNQSLLGLLNALESLKAEVAKLRGQVELQSHQLSTLDKRQSDLYADLDQRVTALAQAAKSAPEVASPAPAIAPAPATPPDSTPPAAETQAYESALKLFREGSYPAAIAGFKTFLKTWPESALAANAQYWIGYAYYALKDYKTALAQQQKLVAQYPASAKVPDALLNIAASQIMLNRLPAARATLEGLIEKYPGTPAAAQASRRLAALK
jgi:tol-pal system protein YbgF